MVDPVDVGTDDTVEVGAGCPLQRLKKREIAFSDDHSTVQALYPGLGRGILSRNTLCTYVEINKIRQRVVLVS